MKENLSTCPFCGGEDLVMVDIELHGGMRETCIECRSCGATGPSTLQDDIHVEYVLPLHAAPGGMYLSAGWEDLAVQLEDMDEDQVKAIFDDRGFACITEAQEYANGESWLCSFRQIGGWVIMGSYATVGNIKLKEDGKFDSCSVYDGIENWFIVWSLTYKQAIAKAINEQRRYFEGEVKKARKKAAKE